MRTSDLVIKGAKQTKPNRLFYGDNLHVLREHVASESVDLVYLDPPFNSNRSYNVLFKEKSGDESPAQIEAFGDTWTWSHETESLYIDMMNGSASNKVKDALEAMRKLLGDNDVLAYLVMITARLVELHRVLKSTGSLYLHCDPTASHYLKVMLDATFDAENFRSEIIWKRYGAHSNSRGFGSIHDVILYYTKSRSAPFNKLYQPHDPEYVTKRYRMQDANGRLFREQTLVNPAVRSNLQYNYTALNGVTYPFPPNGWKCSPERMRELDEQGRLLYPSKPGGMLRVKNYLDEMQGMPVQDLWTDVGYIGSTSPERLGYPTQKPIALLERIVAASSEPGDLILDPFCGCGTAITAAQQLDRKWMGIDVTTLAIDLIDARLRHTYGESVQESYEILGIPRDLTGAKALFARSPFEFERWCVMLVDGQPNEKQVGDRGIDGVIRIPVDAKGKSERILVSVKGGATNPGHVRDLVGTVQSERAAMGVFICMKTPTKAMIDAANRSGLYTYPVNSKKYPKVQIITVEELLAGQRPNMPVSLLPYFQAKRRSEEHDQMILDV